MPDAETIIAALGLQPHPEGGHYLETWRAHAPAGVRSAGSAIYYLLRAGERSAWHRVDAAEAWHHYAGAPLELRTAPGSGERTAQRHVLGTDVTTGQRPQLIVPAGDWQSAAALGEWTLVGCTVSPAFEFTAFELAQPGWEPGIGPPAQARREPAPRTGSEP
jgi:predicted cupin superfamily sugar epimerase